MAKVVTSEGLTAFVQTGQATEIIADKRQKLEKSAPALEIVKTPQTTDLQGESTEKAQKEPSKEAKPEVEDTGLEAEDHDLADRAKKRINKKHYEMKQAEAAAAKARQEAEDSERFAEGLFNERELLRKRLDELEAKGGTAKPDAPVVPTLTKPDPEDKIYLDEKGQFDWRKFSDDNATYAAKKAIADDREEQTKRQRAEANARAEADFKKRIELASQKHPDWHDVVSKSPIVLPNECLQYIARSEYGTDIAYYLAKNPEVAERIRKLDPIEAVAEMGVLKTSFEKPAQKTAAPAEATSKTVERPGAPEPITPISTNGTGSITIDPAKMSFKELRAYRMQEEARKRRH
jgi:hypothetical protein